IFFFFSSRRRHTRFSRDWSSDVCSSDLIRDQGGIALKNGDRLMVDPIIVGRDSGKIEALARKHDIARWGTDLDAALANPDDTIRSEERRVGKERRSQWAAQRSKETATSH